MDPPGSSLYNKVRHNLMFNPVEREGKRLRNPSDTITEGIGINRLTANMNEGLSFIDDAFQGSDQDAVSMSQYILENDGLFLGSSSAMNLVGAVKVCRQLGPGKTVVTILCDGGQRYVTKLYDRDFLAKNKLDMDMKLDIEKL